MTAAAVFAASAGLITTAAPAAHAEDSYNIMIDHHNKVSFIADYCLLSTTSGNGRAACSGNKDSLRAAFRLGVVSKPEDKVWIDINIVAGKDEKRIDLQGKHYIRVYGDIGNVQVCGWKSLASYDAKNNGLSLHGGMQDKCKRK